MTRKREPVWISLCCGLAATECRAMTGRFPPVARMGGKRAYADGVLDILGTWPSRWILVDSDPAIVDFWALVFAGQLPDVAEVLRTAPLDGEELWRLWSSEPVPEDCVERVARWLIVQKGNFSAMPASYADTGAWRGPLSWGSYDGRQGPSAVAKGFRPEHAVLKKERVARRAVEWVGIAGTALRLDLSVSSPLVLPGDLVTIDPPYSGTTGYDDALPRNRVVELATEAHERGARVLVHEAEPVLEGGPWRTVELQRTMWGNQRTWSKQRREVVTINFHPATAHPGATSKGPRGRLAARSRMTPISGPLFD